MEELHIDFSSSEDKKDEGTSVRNMGTRRFQRYQKKKKGFGKRTVDEVGGDVITF